MSEEEARTRDLKIVEKHAADLAEHFESVQIFCTRYEGGDVGTVNVNIGHGNWFARRGQVLEWILKADERTRSEVRDQSAE